MEFEQTQSIIARIQGILREYPCGDTIIYELLQNADDAGATAVQIMLYEGRPDAAAAKPTADPVERIAAVTSNDAPAMFFTNNAVFTDGDLVNIRSIGGADGVDGPSKRHDATKVGRFGVGFNSTYHITDVVAFVSRQHLVVLDPARENLPTTADGRAVGGLKWEYPSIATDPSATPQQKAFVAELLSRFEESGVGFRRDKPFNGTIFRLGLRQRASKLWRECLSLQRLRELTIDFAQSARSSMVLLKNVTTIKALQ